MPRLADRQGRPSRVELGRRIAAERERLGLTAREAARRLHVSHTSYQQMEGPTTLQYGVMLALVRDVGMRAESLAPELFAAE
jgi:transcriptional regulator with XRE-family HTH domain